MRKIALFLIKIYKHLPSFGPSRCIYTPTCSEYAKEAFLKFPFLKALGLVLLRVVRCNPFSKGGFDPVK